jgi:endonuclease YncB( thermonuclease family)
MHRPDEVAASAFDGGDSMMEALGVPYPLPARAIGIGEMDLLGDARGTLKLQGTVERVPAGDSMTVRSGVRRFHVRLVGIDAPKLRSREERQQPWGERARRRLLALAPIGTRVQLVTDRQPFDQDGRLLAHVYRGRHNLNLELVRLGWAVPYQIYPNVSLLGPMESATMEAQAAGRGIFDLRQPLLLLPYEFRHQVDHSPPANFCGDTRTRRYVPPAEYQRVAIAHRVFFRTEADAHAFGYTPAGPGRVPLIEAEDGAHHTARFTPAVLARLKLHGSREAARPLGR